MSIKSAGEVIKEARKRAKLSQEALSDGICSYVTLCNIEKGTYGVSPLTFELLMERAGVYNQIYPIFENLNDYLCFWHLIHARFYLSRWDFKNTHQELDGLYEKNFNKNKYYYQEWCLLTAWLEIKQGNTNHLEICDFLLQALQITKPKINLYDLRKNNISSTEIKIILLYASEYLVLGKIEEGLLIHNQLQAYVDNSTLHEKELNDITIKLEIIQALSNIYTYNFGDALDIIQESINNSHRTSNEKFLFELYYMKALCLYQLKKLDEYNSTRSMLNNCESVMHINYLPYAASYFAKFEIKEFSCDTMSNKILSFVPHQEYNDGSFDIYGREVMSIGSIIKYHREQQKISAKMLCEGLCGLSALSKIENNNINPDIIVASTLLNRLGISDDVFTFFGNKEESLFYDLNAKLECDPHFDKENYDSALEQLNSLADQTNKIIVKQAALYYSIKNSQCSYDSLFEQLNDALKLTIKDFDIQNMSNYRLSKIEFNIVNLMLNCLTCMPKPIESQLYYQQISNYMRNSSIDIVQMVQLYPTANIIYFNFLYTYNLHSNISFEMAVTNHSYLLYTVKGLAFVYYFYVLALCELPDYKKVQELASPIVNTLHFIGYSNDAINLENHVSKILENTSLAI